MNPLTDVDLTVLLNASLSGLNRIEVIEGGKGRQYVRAGALVYLVVQDDGRTIKIFVTPREGWVEDR